MYVYFSMPIFPLGAGTHSAAEFVNDIMQPITDAEHGKAKRQNTFIGGRRIYVIDGRWTTAQDDAGRPVALDLIQGRVTRENCGKDLQFTDAARNKLRIMRAKVEDDNGLVFHEQFSLIRSRV